jgi:hypothetical protein
MGLDDAAPAGLLARPAAPLFTTKASMQVLLHSAPHTDARHGMADHLEAVVKAALDRFGERVTRVEGHLTDEDGSAKAGAHGVHCSLQALLLGLDTVAVEERAGNAHQAIEGAVRKLKRMVGAAIAKHDPRGQREKVADALETEAGPAVG